MQPQKRQNDLCSFPRQTIQYHGNPSLYPNQYCWRSWSWMVLWRPARLECKRRKSRNTWSNRQICPWSTEWSKAKANRVLPSECSGKSKHPLWKKVNLKLNNQKTKVVASSPITSWQVYGKTMETVTEFICRVGWGALPGFSNTWTVNFQVFRTRDQIANICWIIKKAREFQKNILYWLCQSLWLCESQ